jgi:cell division protein YceG involved in septum cleavage
MRKIVHYLLISSVVILVTAIIVGLFYSRYVYRHLISNNDSGYASFISRVVNKLSGHSQPEIKFVPKEEDTISILEGWNSRDIGQYFESLGKWQSEEFLESAGFPRTDYRYHKELPALADRSDKFTFLADKPKYYGLEGYLFPDTYRVYATSTVDEAIDKMLSNFDRKLTAKMRSDIKAQGKTIYSIVTMASLIEKEAPIDYQNNDSSDAKTISGIFWNRLKIGQPLQSDATLSYILNDNKPQHSGRELEIDSPYNTYRYRGLPPGPICNPGLLAIEAAIYPTDTDYFYFLTPKGKEDVIYARTYEEHLQNKYKYLK